MARIDLRSRPIAITGASSGIGEASAVACARAGMPVGLFARRADRLEALAERIRGEGGRAVAVAGSVEDPGACARLIEETERAFGPVYAVFANAGFGQSKETWEMTREEVRRMFDVNVHGSMHVIRPALAGVSEAGMLGRGEGHVVMCSSGLSKVGVPRYGWYCATKAAQDQVGRAMRLELRSRGVAVSTVHPVLTATEFPQAAGRTTEVRTASWKVQRPERVADALVRRLAKGRGGEVWTSQLSRLALAATGLSPTLTDWALGRAHRKHEGEAMGNGH